ncbi:ketosteroid isomerase [Xanthomonas oryzae pv. oryzicola]|nr:ketosteroid isomerase [Xanthomonas oryzae pv. oryzicola]QGH65085.1 DUF4440 domain-containing protein [Xanthomonas oryzae pv. oryzicola]UBB93808.1 nuclear transport factor 2 family protein [Xanthomonas oryzae pv. oryzicola]WGY41770.1 SnoaL-like domain-containing protein [Xanthomonas oryzae pv. oryzicola]
MTRRSAIAAATLLVAAAFAGNVGTTSTDTASAGTCAEQPLLACNKRIVEAVFAQWQTGGSGIFETLLSPDVVWTIEGSGPSAGTLLGRDALVDAAVRPLTKRLASPLRPVQQRIRADGEHVIVQWEATATLRDGGSDRNRCAWIMRMADGKAVEVNAFLDLPAYDAVLQRGHRQMQRRAAHERHADESRHRGGAGRRLGARLPVRGSCASADDAHHDRDPATRTSDASTPRPRHAGYRQRTDPAGITAERPLRRGPRHTPKRRPRSLRNHRHSHRVLTRHRIHR